MNRDEKIVARVFFMTYTPWITDRVFCKDIAPKVDDSTIAIASEIYFLWFHRNKKVIE